MIYLIAAALALAFLAALAYIAWLVFLRPDPDPADSRPLVAPALSVDADTEVFWPSRHHEDTVEIVDPATYQAPLYSRAFAAAMGLDGPEAGR
jgi:hypothetical protein